MATPKFDRILQEFSRRIGDRLDSAFVPGAGAFPNGTLLGNTDAIAYVNKALHKYHGDAWMAVEGDKNAFVRLFPEIVLDPRSITFTSGRYIIAANNLDYFYINSAFLNTTPRILVRITAEENLSLLLTDRYPRHGPTVSKPILCPAGDSLYIFPTSITAVVCHFIIQPLNRTNGAFLAQNGSYDSPFYDIHNSRIATVAEQLYWNEKEPKP